MPRNKAKQTAILTNPDEGYTCFIEYNCNMEELKGEEGGLKQRWEKLLEELSQRFGKKPDLNAILLLIGMRELGIARTKVSKEQKVSLMHIAVCGLLSKSGYYELKGHDKDGWPIWDAVKKIPNISVFEQEIFLKQHIVDYFESL
jgi:hypothetical protein